MAIEFLILLAIVQGITEFLPISSSAHLIMAPKLLGVADQGVVIDGAVHVGTLVAVVTYFWREVRSAVIGGVDILRWRASPERKLALLLILATIPVMALGAVLKFAGLTDRLRDMEVIGWMTIIFGAALYLADRWSSTALTRRDWSWRHAAAMGGAQALALIPGVSRSGVTISAARSLGYGRIEAARLSMLMSVPTIIAGGALLSLDIVEQGAALGIDALIAATLSCLAALAALTVMMRMLRSWSFTPFVIYRLATGMALLWYAYA